MMRDHVPTGIICAAIQESEPSEGLEVGEGFHWIFTNPNLAALADDYAGRIVETSSVSEQAGSD